MAFPLEDIHLPATLTMPPMTDEEFAAFCAEHEEFSFEMTAEGDLVVLPLSDSIDGVRNAEIVAQFAKWAKEDSRGVTTDSSAGFVLPNGARRSADMAWTRRSAIEQIPPDEREGFWHLCPAFVIERRQAFERLPVMREKMREWIANGAELGWLIDPESRSVEAYRPNREPELHADCESIAGAGPVDGFVLDLRLVWDPLAGE